MERSHCVLRCPRCCWVFKLIFMGASCTQQCSEQAGGPLWVSVQHSPSQNCTGHRFGSELGDRSSLMVRSVEGRRISFYQTEVYVPFLLLSYQLC